MTDSGLKPRFTKTTIAVASAFFVLGVLGWFAFTAKSVQFVLEPAADEFGLPGTLFQLQLGERYLLRAGSHRLTASLPGYYPVDSTVEVGPSADQTIRIEFTKLPGLITFMTDPEVTEVKVDGVSLGQTPLADIEIVPGTHQIEFSSERYLSEVREFLVSGGHEEQTLNVSLTPSWAPVRLTSEPVGAEVLVDGEVFGATPIELELGAGERQIEVRLRGFNVWNEQIRVVADEPQELPPVVLVPADGRVALNSSPSDVNVTVNGTFRGRTPLTLRLSPSRAHTIVLEKPGYARVTRELSVAADSGRDVNIALEAQIGQVDISGTPADAEIWVDGERVGAAPRQIDLMAIEHSIEVRLDGYRTESFEITPRPGFPQSLPFELEQLNEVSGGGYRSQITTSLGQQLRLVPAGRFTMGSSRREEGRSSREVMRAIEISRAAYIGATEVTNAEFRAFAPDHDSGEFAGLSLNDDDQPVVRVTWREAAEYLNWLSIEDGLQPVYTETPFGLVPVRPLRNGYRLPTEAEWAWAARAAGRETTLIFPWGDAWPAPDRFANYADLSAAEILPTSLATYNDGFPVAAPVGSFGRNAVGLFDMGGNVAEWTQDIYELSVLPSEDVVIDPLGPESGRFRVIRGPSWRNATTGDLRFAARNYSVDQREDLGFRIARNLK